MTFVNLKKTNSFNNLVKLFILAAVSIQLYFPPGGFSQTRRQSGVLTQGIISSPEWHENGRTLVFLKGNVQFHVDLESGIITESGELSIHERRALHEKLSGKTAEEQKQPDPRIKAPSRGRQYMAEKSPDGKWYALCEDWNVVLENTHTGEKKTVTADGHRKFRYGTANWVYGEELDVKHGMWWTPDSRMLIYYVFDERPVTDFYLIDGWTDIITRQMTEGYTKAGDPNPLVSLEILDMESGSKTRIDCGENVYLYALRFTPDGKELLINRTDRKQRVLDVLALNPSTGALRTIVTEKQKTWQENNPYMAFLEDGSRFIWETEKTGYRHYELRDLAGNFINTLTKGYFSDEMIIDIDEDNGWLYYMAFGDEKNPLNRHLHRVRLNGKDQTRLTLRPAYHSSVSLCPDRKWFTVQYEDVKTPVSTALYDMNGNETVLAEGMKIDNPRSEIFSFTASDSITQIYGILHKPDDFDPGQKYPLIINVYGGPDSRAVYNRFSPGGGGFGAQGYLVAQIDNRGTSGRGKAFKDAVYGKLGNIDIQDQADGARYLIRRPYVDAERTGIIGHSYGGFMAAIGILRFPELFSAAVNRAGVTCWKNYDSIYTERYMDLPQDNPDGYETANCMNYAENLKGRLLIMHGMLDDNVHPNNAFQLINALNRAEKHKHFEERFLPGASHGFGGYDVVYDFFSRAFKMEMKK